MNKKGTLFCAVFTRTLFSLSSTFALSMPYNIAAVGHRSVAFSTTSKSSRPILPPDIAKGARLSNGRSSQVNARESSSPTTWKVSNPNGVSVQSIPASPAEPTFSSGAGAAAINARLASGSVTLPCGSYTLYGPILLNRSGEIIRGTNPACTRLIVKFADGDVIESRGPGISNTSVRDLEISASVKRKSGYAIDLIRTFQSGVSNIVIDNAQGGRQFGGIKVSGANTTAINDVEMTGGGSSFGYYLTSAGGQQAIDTFITRSNVSSYLDDMAVDNASGIYLDKLDLILSLKDGLLVEPIAPGANVNALLAESVLVDTSSGSGWVFTGTLPITEVKLTNCWGSGSGTLVSGSVPTAPENGLLAQDPALSGLSIQSSHFHHNGGNGISIVGGSEIQIGAGTTTLMNSAAGFAKADGIYIAAPANFVQLNGIISGQGGYMSEVAKLRNYQRYGVYISPNESSSLIQADMILTRDNAVGGVVSPAHSGTIEIGKQVVGN